jgi:hypothetical protein
MLEEVDLIKLKIHDENLCEYFWRAFECYFWWMNFKYSLNKNIFTEIQPHNYFSFQTSNIIKINVKHFLNKFSTSSWIIFIFFAFNLLYLINCFHKNQVHFMALHQRSKEREKLNNSSEEKYHLSSLSITLRYQIAI